MINYTGLYTYENFKKCILKYLECEDKDVKWHGISIEALDALIELNIKPIEVKENKLVCLGKTIDGKVEHIIIDIQDNNLFNFMEDYLRNNFVEVRTNNLRVFNIKDLYLLEVIRYDHSINFIELAIKENDDTYKSILDDESIDKHHIKNIIPIHEVLNKQ